MKSRFSHILVLFCAILAFMPVLAVGYLLDNYVRGREFKLAQTSVDAITAEAQGAVYGGIDAIRSAVDNSPSLCTPTFVHNVQTQLQSNFALRQMLVENADGVQYCDGFDRSVNFVTLSQELPIPGQHETLSIVRFEGETHPTFRITRIVGTKLVSAFTLISSRLAQGLPPELWAVSSLRLSLTNGEEILTIGKQQNFADPDVNAEYLMINAFSGELPIMVEAAIPFDLVRASYADLDVALTIIACLISGGFLVLGLYYFRQSKMPSFDLENAILSGELKPYYQPVIDLQTGHITGCEVLVRWVKKNGDVIPPGSFIDYAEITGLALPMTVSLMQSVRADLEELCADTPGLKISINLFEGHFANSSIVEDVQAIFGGSSIDFRQLVFEITERRPLNDNAETMSVVNGLHALGSRLAMDDVGTGHSNLAFLDKLGIDIIKIDRVFVDMVTPETTSVPVLDGLINMANDMKAEIVAEGVETEAQALYLRKRNVVHAQGYLFAPALKADSFVTLARALARPQKKDTSDDSDYDGFHDVVALDSPASSDAAA